MIKNIFCVTIVLFLASCGYNKKTEKNQKDTTTNKQFVDSVKIGLNSNNFLIGDTLESAEVSKKKYFDYYDELVFVNIEKLSFEYENNILYIFIDSIVEFDGPKGFQRINIKKNNEKEVVFFNGDTWLFLYDNSATYPQVAKDNNMITSNCISIQKMSDDNVLLFLFGAPYPEGSLLTIINLTYFKQPTLIFNLPADLYAVKDLDNDGIKDIIIKNFPNDADDTSIGTETNYYLKNGWFVKGTSKKTRMGNVSDLDF